MSEFRKIALQKLAAKLGIAGSIGTSKPVVNRKTAKSYGKLTEFVKTHLGDGDDTSSFKEAFLKLPPGTEREKLVYEEVIKRNLKTNLVPVTVEMKDGTKVTYKVMPDYITIDGLRVPMSGRTAQKVADHFGMVLPTDKMSDQIYDAADVKLRPPPLSSSGFRDKGGRYYSAEEVVKHKIGDPDAALAYSEQIEKELAQKGKSGLVAGHMKDVIMPYDPEKLGLYGWRGEDGGLIQTPRTPHDTSVHTEYGAGTRLADSKVTVTTPDGRTIDTTMDKLMAHPELYKSISNFKGVRRYA